MTYHFPRPRAVELRQKGRRVALLVGGKCVLDIDWSAAETLAKALYTQAKKGEEFAKADAIINDNAVLLRSGAPLGLSSHPKIKAETIKTALNDPKLRRYMPGGVKSRAILGTPTIIKGTGNAQN